MSGDGTIQTWEELEKRREKALVLLRFPEGSFAHAFLEAFVRADSANLEILADDFDAFSHKFHWEEKYAKQLEREQQAKA